MEYLFLTMKHLLPILIFFICCSAATGQKTLLTASVASSTSACDVSEKLFRISRTGENGDSAIWSKEDTVCTFSVRLDLPPGNYLLHIRNSDAEAEAAFEVTDPVAEIDLGKLALTTRISGLEEVTITGVPKKFIQIDAEKTVVTVENNPILEVSSVYDAILKIPGIIPYPGGGFALGGQLAAVYFDGIPSSLSTTDLENLLKSLPAVSVQKIELIANPGASYDASFGGSIIDIISQGRVSKWLSGTVTLNSGFNRNQKHTPSLMLSGKGKKHTWQMQTGYSHHGRDYRYEGERTYNYFDTTTRLRSERSEEGLDRYAYFRPSFTRRFGQNSLLQVHAGISGSGNDLEGRSMAEIADSSGSRLLADFERKGRGYQLEGGVKYRIFLDTLKRKIEVGVNAGHYDYLSKRLTTQITDETTYTLQNNATTNNWRHTRADAEIPFPKWKSQLNTGAKFMVADVLSDGGYRFNDSLRPELSTNDFTLSVPFGYNERNIAGYVEWKQRFGKKLSLTAGLRAEDFSLEGKIGDNVLLKRHYFNLFPSVHMLYRVVPEMINFTASYSRKINLPGYGQFDPNISGYYDNYTASSGNTALEPNFFHRSNAKITVFDYLQISVTHSLSNSINLSEITADSNSYFINQTQRTYKNVQAFSYFFALPVPFGFFKQGMGFFEQAIDVDAISFVYLYAEGNRTIIPGYEYVNGNKSYWVIGAYSQFILPYKIRMNVEYNYTMRGMFQLTETTKPIHDVEIVLSREFSDKKWRVSLTLQDVFNSNANYARTSYAPLTINSYYKQDTRVLWIRVARSFGRYERPSLGDGGGIPAKGE
jgi:iron complex outermembrane recepter protein